MSVTDRRRRIAHIVKKVFGLSDLRPGQQAVIDAVLASTHTLCHHVQGAGKSLCYLTREDVLWPVLGAQL